jgi:hypothetical protein
MNAKPTVLTAASLLAPIFVLAAPVSPASASPPQPVEITIDCARPALPSQAAFARLAGIDNPGQAYAARARLMLRAQRACQPGVARLQVMLEPAARDQATPMAQLAKPAR